MALNQKMPFDHKEIHSFAVCLILFLCLNAWGCARRAYQFSAQEPQQQLEDQKHIPVPKKRNLNIREYVIAATARLPLQRYLDTARFPRSGDVNALDDVPESTWFTRRLGYREITPSEMTQGPARIVPPQPPFEVVKLKTEGTNPGFHIRDTRGHRYLIKLDSPEAVHLETTISYVVNRLFWAFGYHVPEDYIFYFDRSQLHFAPENSITPDEVDAILFHAVQDKNGRYRTAASLFLPGIIIGHPDQKGTRKDDANDRIPHETMRTLRALKVFCALTQQTAMRSDNMLDVYEGAPGEGYVRHYLLDFGETMGVHGLGWQWPWDGFEHFFDWKDHLRDSLLLGINHKPWEKIQGDPHTVETYYESKEFRFRDWKEVYPFEPIRQSQPEDDYWAAKIIAALKEEHVEALFRETAHPDEKTVRYLTETLMQRRQKIVEEAFRRVTPLESAGLRQNQLQLVDQSVLFLKAAGEKYSSEEYFVEYFNRDNKKIREPEVLALQEENLTITVDPALLQKADGYIRLQVHRLIQKDSPRPAQFHIREVNGSAQVVGVVH